MNALRVFYFGYFLGWGVYQPYLSLLFKQKGFTGVQIGMLSALLPAASLFVPPLVGLVTDRYRGRRSFLAGTALLSVPFLACAIGLNQFAYVVVAVSVFMVLICGAPPVADGMTIEVLGERTHLYGSVRLWGSIGYAVGVLATGKALESAGWGMVLGVYLVSGGLAAAAALSVSEGGGERQPPSQVTWLRGLGSLAGNRLLLAFLTIVFLQRIATIIYLNFFSLFLADLKMGSGLIGVIWTVGAVFEILIMALSQGILKRFGSKVLYLTGLVGNLVRWSLYSFVSNQSLIVATQLLHGLGPGAATVGAIAIMDEQTPAGLKTTGQGILFAVMTGLAGLVGTVMGGFMLDRLGIRKLFVLSAWLELTSIILFGLWVAASRRAIGRREQTADAH